MADDAGILIVGTGHAGYTLARELRRLDATTPLTLISADDGASYYKPNLSKALAMGKTADDLITADAAAMAATLDARVLAGRRVRAIDPGARRVDVDGESISYRDLVLAVGARPIRLPLAGDAADQALSVNNHRDYAEFRHRLRDGARVLIIGAGLIGCEFANDLAAAGYPVTVVDIAGWPLPQLLPEPCGENLRAALAALGVQWHFGRRVQRVDADGAALAVSLDDGSRRPADLVLSAVGLKPNTELAAAAGIHCEQGIVVDAMLRSSAEHVYALGDCAQIHGRVLPFVLPIAHGARALARTLCGEPTPAVFPPMPVLVKTPACPTVVCPAAPGAAGRWQILGQAPDLEAVFVDAQGSPLGFALQGQCTRRRAALSAQMPPLGGG